MLRDRNLVPLSRQHQHALALCVRIERALRAGPVNASSWRAEMERDFEQEIQFHFAAEEQVLFPVACRFVELGQLVDELLEEHGRLRTYFAQAKQGPMDATELGKFAELLSSHIRKEERRLFEEMQKLLSQEELATMGVALERSLEGALRVCQIQNPSPEDAH